MADYLPASMRLAIVCDGKHKHPQPIGQFAPILIDGEQTWEEAPSFSRAYVRAFDAAEELQDYDALTDHPGKPHRPMEIPMVAAGADPHDQAPDAVPAPNEVSSVEEAAWWNRATTHTNYLLQCPRCPQNLYLRDATLAPLLTRIARREDTPEAGATVTLAELRAMI